ncbi:MAG: recombinase family protein [Solirubrobacteraceae bacterium]
MTRAGIYARISEDRDETQAGVGRQVEDCERLAGIRGWKVVERYVDNDLSAYRGNKRPEYRRMLEDIGARRLDAVIVYHQDRLHRQPRELEEFFDACDAAGLTQLASVSGDIDLSTHDGRLKARILGAVARNQSDAASRRLQRKALQLAQEGGVAGGGTRPFGFEADFATVREPEAEIIRELAERLIAGETLRTLCKDLHERGIRTPTARPWSPTPLRRMLRSARISGQREHRGEIVAGAQWPAIITPEQTRSIRTLVDDPARRAARPARTYLLRGLLRCAVCEAPLVARPRGDGERRYICPHGPGLPGKGCVYALAEPLEEFVVEAVLWQLDSPELAEAIRGNGHRPVTDWDRQIDGAQTKLDELAGAYAGGAISLREWLVAREPLQQQLDVARRRSAQDGQVEVLAEYVGRSGTLRKRWPDLGFDRQRAILAAVLAEVLVRPGRPGFNRFDPNRFELVWRH